MIDPTSILIFGGILLLVTFALVAVLVFSPLKNKEKEHLQRLLYWLRAGYSWHWWADPLSVAKMLYECDRDERKPEGWCVADVDIRPNGD